MEKQKQQGLDPFAFPEFTYSVGLNNVLIDQVEESSDPRLLSSICEFQQKYPEQYTMIIIALRPEKKEKLEKIQEQKKIVAELGELYYFKMSPTLLKETLDNLPNLADSRSSRATALTKKRKANQAAAYEEEVEPAATPIRIELSVFTNDNASVQYVIGEETNFVSQCITKAKAFCPFEMTISQGIITPTTVSLY